jgi:hypothetical protein
MATGKGDIATRERKGKFSKKRKRKLCSLIQQVLDDMALQALEEKVGHSREGGKEMLKALFGLVMKGKRVKGKQHVFQGRGKYARRQYKVTKLGGGRYRVTRVV